MTSILKPRVFAGAGVLALAAGCALLLTVPRLVALDIATANVALPATEKNPALVRVAADQMHQLAIVPVAPDPFPIQNLPNAHTTLNEAAITTLPTPLSGHVS